MIFGTGRTTIDGDANYLEEPFPGARARFTIADVPLSAFDPEIRQINVAVSGGRLSGAAWSTLAQDHEGRGRGRDLSSTGLTSNYVHSPATQQAEARRVEATGRQIEKQNNRAAVDINVREFDITHSNFAFTDQTSDPNYRCSSPTPTSRSGICPIISDQGPADLTLHGKFMGSGDTSVSGTYLASQHGPTLELKVAIQNT